MSLSNTFNQHTLYTTVSLSLHVTFKYVQPAYSLHYCQPLSSRHFQIHSTSILSTLLSASLFTPPSNTFNYQTLYTTVSLSLHVTFKYVQPANSLHYCQPLSSRHLQMRSTSIFSTLLSASLFMSLANTFNKHTLYTTISLSLHATFKYVQPAYSLRYCQPLSLHATFKCVQPAYSLHYCQPLSSCHLQIRSTSILSTLLSASLFTPPSNTFNQHTLYTTISLSLHATFKYVQPAYSLHYCQPLSSRHLPIRSTSIFFTLLSASLFTSLLNTFNQHTLYTTISLSLHATFKYIQPAYSLHYCQPLSSRHLQIHSTSILSTLLLASLFTPPSNTFNQHTLYTTVSLSLHVTFKYIQPAYSLHYCQSLSSCYLQMHSHVAYMLLAEVTFE